MTKEETILKLRTDMELRGRSPSTIRYLKGVSIWKTRKF